MGDDVGKSIMIISDEEVDRRLNSPLNLMNRLRKHDSRSAMELFTKRFKSEEVIASDTDTTRVQSNMSSMQTGISSTPISSVPAIAGEPHPAENTQVIPQEQTTLDNLIQNHESQIKLGLAHDKGLNLLGRSLDLLTAKLDDIKADRLPLVMREASSIVERIRRERNEAARDNRDREVHYHFYTPNQKSISDYEIIDVQ